MAPNEFKIRTGSLIIEKSYIYSSPASQHTVRDYGIVLSTDNSLGVEILWSNDGNITFHHDEAIAWFVCEEATKYLDHTITKFWTIYY